MATGHEDNHQELADFGDATTSELMDLVSWLRKVAELEHIQAQQLSSAEVVLNLAKSGPLAIDYHRSSKAILFSVEHYTQLVDALAHFKTLAADHALAQETTEFQQLYDRLTSEDSATAADSMFSASEEDFAKSFNPCPTERPTQKR